MAQLLLHNASVVTEDGVKPGSVLARDGLIAGVFSPEQTPTGLSAAEAIDLRDAYLAPGLIDIHIHGSAGVDVQAADAEALAALSAYLLAEGVTGYFPTLVPSDEQGYRESLAALKSHIANSSAQDSVRHSVQRGAHALGVHFEGPFVSEHRCGALQPRHFRTYDGDPRSIELFSDAAITRLMTLAPELEGGLELTAELTRGGARAFIGHSQAGPEVLDHAAEAGARHMTHFPNALDPLHHRKPGAVGWSLLRRDITMDCIADFHHVDPMMLKLIYQSKGAAGMALISDAIKPAGLGDGDFVVWGEKIAVRNGRTALAGQNNEGTIAGSVISLRRAVQNMVGLGVPLHHAVLMASLNPAQVAGVDRERGSIVEGKRADLIAFDDTFAIQLAVVGGKVQSN